MPKRLARRRQHVGEWKVAPLHSAREYLRIDAIGLATVFADAESLDARCVHEKWPVSPPFENRHRGPRLSAGLHRNFRTFRFRAENILELLDGLRRPPRDHDPVSYLAEGDLSRPQIQRYIPHRRPLLSPRSDCVVRTRGGV